MKHHWAYFKYVVRHKWFVFVAGRKLKVSLWRLIKHDFSKFSKQEWTPYVNSFYTYHNGGRPDWVKKAFNRAWLHHQHVNDHHWQHWVLIQDSGDQLALRMPTVAIREMVADWMGAGRAITGKWEVEEWYEKMKEKIVLHEDTRKLVERLICGPCPACGCHSEQYDGHVCEDYTMIKES